jgi:hypothetical protein
MAEEKKVLLHVDPDLYSEFKALAAKRKTTIKKLLHEVMNKAVIEAKAQRKSPPAKQKKIKKP